MKFNQSDLILIGVFITLVFLTYHYIETARKVNEIGQLTPEMVDEMSKDEIKLFIDKSNQIREKYNVLPQLFLLVSGIGVFIGYSLSKVYEKRLNCSKVLEFLPKEEKDAVKVILDEGGKVPQHIWRLKLKLNKSKATRLAYKLEKRGIVEVERIGKINRLKLTKSFMDALGFKK